MRRVLVILWTASLVLAACGQPDDAATPASDGHTVELHQRDAGRTVRLVRGERLALSLGSSSSDPRWQLALYPKKLLSLVMAKHTDDFVFKALRPGRGRIVALDLARLGGVCGGGGFGAGPSHECPVLGRSSEEGVPPRPGVFGITVIVH
jgi:hypothetical protein